MANIPMKDIQFPGLDDKYTFAQIDNTLTQTGQAADAKKTGDEISELKADFTQLDDKIAAAQITNTASGSIASFPDGADGVPVKDLTVQIEPVQDLHGQANPYPAGGGKNLLNTSAFTEGTYKGVTIKIQDDGSLLCNGTVSEGGGVVLGSAVLAPGTYAFTGVTNGNTAGSFYLNFSGLVNVSTTERTYTVSETTTTTCALQLTSGYQMNNVVIKPMIRKSTDSADFAPYSNICPISGWTGAKVQRTSKNLCNISAIGDVYSTQQNIRKGIVIGKAGTYTVSAKEFTRGTIYSRLYTNADGYGSANLIASTGAKNHKTYTVEEGDRLIVFEAMENIPVSDAREFFATAKIQIELGSTETAYEPDNGNTYSITFPTEAGTVYGGTLDVTSGVLTVDKKSVTLDEDSNWTMYAEGKFFCPAITVNEASLTTAGAGYLCNQYLVAGNGDTTSSYVAQDKRVYGQRQYGRFWVYDSAYSTLEAFKTALESNALQIVYPLTTPITIQLDPVTIATLLGLNNIWADCGDVSVDYRADTKLYIEKLTAPTEDDMVANTNIPSDTYFMIGNTLYLSTTTIPAGDTINPGTNCTLMNLASALNALNS